MIWCRLKACATVRTVRQDNPFGVGAQAPLSRAATRLALGPRLLAGGRIFCGAGCLRNVM